MRLPLENKGTTQVKKNGKITVNGEEFKSVDDLISAGLRLSTRGRLINPHERHVIRVAGTRLKDLRFPGKNPDEQRLIQCAEKLTHYAPSPEPWKTAATPLDTALAMANEAAGEAVAKYEVTKDAWLDALQEAGRARRGRDAEGERLPRNEREVDREGAEGRLIEAKAVWDEARTACMRAKSKVNRLKQNQTRWRCEEHYAETCKT